MPGTNDDPKRREVDPASRPDTQGGQQKGAGGDSPDPKAGQRHPAPGRDNKGDMPRDDAKQRQ